MEIGLCMIHEKSSIFIISILFSLFKKTEEKNYLLMDSHLFLNLFFFKLKNSPIMKIDIHQ